MLTLYSMQPSGNCYKLRLALHQTGTPFALHDVDVLKGECRTPEFLAKNPYGKVPLLELADGRFLPESNAGLYYLANGTPLLPDDPYERAQTLQWMFFEQYSHEPYIAVARFWWSIAPDGRVQKADEFANWHKRGYQALEIMDKHLSNHDFLAAGRYTVADIALYAYTHVAPEGGFDLAPYKNINKWLSRIKRHIDHIDINWRP
ncbi:MAG: glutathione S-transferase family protein [Hyphomicrobiaceae bacterium]|nr:glutathione S-transferase family protein [Hyphomicrobiaceae bacterium]